MIRSTDWQVIPKDAPKGKVLFAIGDVHGRADLLEEMQTCIRDDHILPMIAAGTSPDAFVVVYLGDYIDRGPESCRAIDLVRSGLGVPGILERRLMGNHEQIMLLALSKRGDADQFVDTWLRNGGWKTIETFEHANDGKPTPLFSSERERIRWLIGEERLAFLSSLPTYHREGDLVFAHAGIDPAIPLDFSLGQHWHDGFDTSCLWIRRPFLRHDGLLPQDVLVIHGHSIGDAEILPHRIGIDTGAYLNGELTAALIIGGELRFLSAIQEPARITAGTSMFSSSPA